MRPEDRDVAYLFDMLECCKDIISFTSNVSFSQFASEKMRRLATERRLETLGEAANRVSVARQAALPNIDWARIVGLRNKLAHDYGEVLAERVWLIAVQHVKELRAQLEAIEDLADARAEIEQD